MTLGSVQRPRSPQSTWRFKKKETDRCSATQGRIGNALFGNEWQPVSTDPKNIQTYTPGRQWVFYVYIYMYIYTYIYIYRCVHIYICCFLGLAVNVTASDHCLFCWGGGDILEAHLLEEFGGCFFGAPGRREAFQSSLRPLKPFKEVELSYNKTGIQGGGK